MGFAARRAHNITKWDASAVQNFVRNLGLGDAIRLPSTMTGIQLCRLGRRGLVSLCSDEESAEKLHQALLNQREAAREAGASQLERNAKITALGNHKVHAADSTRSKRG